MDDVKVELLEVKCLVALTEVDLNGKNVDNVR